MERASVYYNSSDYPKEAKNPLLDTLLGKGFDIPTSIKIIIAIVVVIVVVILLTWLVSKWFSIFRAVGLI